MVSHTTIQPNTIAAGKQIRAKELWFLFLAFTIYLVVPVIDVPLLGLSLSAFLMFLIALDVLLSKHDLRLGDYSTWIIISYAFLFGLLLSIAGNVIFRGVPLEPQDILTLIRYGYWVLAFFITMIVVASAENLKTIGLVIALGVFILTGLRFYEAIIWGQWGAGIGTQFLSQNSYGIQFSTFFPFVLALPFVLKGWARNLFSMALILVIAAIAGNGSRSSWIAVTTGAILFLLLYAVTQRGGIWLVQSRLVVVVGLLIIVAALVPQSILDPIISRFDTLETIEQDKSYALRQLMIQKGQRLFENNPLYGAGIGRFRRASVPLDIPNVLSYLSQSHFDVQSAHNSYIALVGETGLVGTIPFVVLHLVLFIKGLPAAIELARKKEVWAIAIFAAYVGMSLHLWSLAGLTGTAPWYVYGLMAGVIEREKRLSKEKLN